MSALYEAEAARGAVEARFKQSLRLPGRSAFKESSGVNDDFYAAEIRSADPQRSWLDEYVQNPRLRSCIEAVRTGTKMVRKGFNGESPLSNPGVSPVLLERHCQPKILPFRAQPSVGYSEASRGRTQR